MRVAGQVDPVFVDDIGAMAGIALRNARAGDVLLCMGAGSISAVPGQIVALLQTPAGVETTA
jgi:UDP-N-acetylmuramate--alanine ligase